MPLPPGGLIPYRKGLLWGYADTTGRVVIAPRFEREPQLFLFGFGQLHPIDRDGYVTFINAQGQALQSDDTHAIIFTADSSLQRVPRRDYYLAPTLDNFRIGERGASVRTTLLPPPGWAVYGMEVLGEQRSAIRRHQPGLPAKANVLAPQLLRFGLVDADSRALTKFIYSRIHPFQEGFARFERDGGEGLMNRQGQEIYFTPVGSVSDFYRGRALVQVITGRLTQEKYRTPADPPAVSHVGVIDTMGRLQQPLRSHMSYWWLVPGKIICEATGLEPRRVYRLLDFGQQPLLNAQRFTSVEFEPATQRIVVRGMHGEAGLLDTDLNWILAFQQQQLYYQSNRGVLALARQGRHGLVSAYDGRTIVPLRYDTVYTALPGGLAEVEQQGKRLIINFEGRELARGWLDELYFRANAGLGLRLWQVRQEQYSSHREGFLLDSTGHTFPATADTYRPTVLGPGLLLYTTRGQYSQKGVRTPQGREVVPSRYQQVEWKHGYIVANRAGVDSLLRTTQVYDLYSPTGKLLYSGTQHLYIRAAGWVHLDAHTVLSPTGQLMRLPTTESWARDYAGRDNQAGAYPFQFGVARVQSSTGGGYITRGGRRLWQE